MDNQNINLLIDLGVEKAMKHRRFNNDEIAGIFTK